MRYIFFYNHVLHQMVLIYKINLPFLRHIVMLRNKDGQKVAMTFRVTFVIVITDLWDYLKIGRKTQSQSLYNK